MTLRSTFGASYLCYLEIYGNSGVRGALGEPVCRVCSTFPIDLSPNFGVVGGGKWGTVGPGVGKVAAPQELNEQPQNATEVFGRA